MQIKGEEFLRKVQLQQEREELERKLSEIEEVRSSIGSNNNQHQSYPNNAIPEERDSELDNIMLNTSIGANEENKKKYLILAIVLVILFLLTIIIIRLLTNNPNKNDQFTAGASTPKDMKKMPEGGSNIEENYQKIMNDRLKKDSSESSSQGSADDRLKALQQQVNSSQLRDMKEDSSGGVSNEALEETMKKIEEKRTGTKEKVTDTTTKKVSTVAKDEETTPKVKEKQKEVVEKKSETAKNSIKDLMNTTSAKTTATPTHTRANSKVTHEAPSATTSANGYFIQIGAFSKKPTDSYLNNIKSANLKYKIHEENKNGSTINKLLIGPYASKEAANAAVSSVKQKLNVASAFVVKF